MTDTATQPLNQTSAPPKEAPKRVRQIGGSMEDGFERDDQPGTSAFPDVFIEAFKNDTPQIPDVAAESSPEPQGISSGSIPFNIVEAAETIVEQTHERMKKVAEIGKDTFEATADLFTKQIFGIEKHQAPKTEEEQEKEVEFHFTREKHQDLAANQNIVRQQEEQKNVIRIVGDAIGMRKEDKNARLKLNENYQQAEEKPYYAVQLRIALKAEEEKIEDAEEQQSLSETTSTVVDMNALAEGGMGKGSANMSATGGAGAG